MLKNMLLSFIAGLKAFIVGLLATINNGWNSALAAVAVHGKVGAFGAVFRDMAKAASAGQLGAVSIELIILVFVAIVILYQLIPQISNSNVTVQQSDNVTAMGKFGAGLGEWLFPILGIIGVVMLLLQHKGKGKGT